jgi:hypothetical protein
MLIESPTQIITQSHIKGAVAISDLLEQAVDRSYLIYSV